MGRRELNQAEVARRLGENEMWVYRRIRGKQLITIADLHRIATALDVGVHDLLPPPDAAAKAASPGTMASYPMPSSRMTQPGSRPRDNRPNGHPGTATVGSPGRTTYLSRGNRRNRG